MILHHGYVPHTSPPANWLPRCIAFWKNFLADKDGSIVMHIENVLEWEPGLILDLVDGIGTPGVDVNLDIGHVHCNARTNLEDWIRKLGRRIGYVHIHDNHGTDDEHLALGKGSIPLETVLRLLQEQSPAALWAVETEVDGLAKSLEWLGDRAFFTRAEHG